MYPCGKTRNRTGVAALRALSRFLPDARDVPRGELRQRYKEGQEDQIGALGLVLNVVVLFNTRYLQAAVDEFTRQGHEFADKDVERLSPFVRAHVNTQGRYGFSRPELGGELRTLSDPDEDGPGGGSKGSAG